MTEPLLTRYDAPGRPARRDPDAARRQAPRSEQEVDGPQRLVAPRGVDAALDRAAGPRGGRRRCGCCATGSAGWNGGADRSADARWAPRPSCAPSTATSPSSCSGTRWAPGSPCTWPTTPRSSAWSGWPRGGRPRTRSPPWPVATAGRRARAPRPDHVVPRDRAATSSGRARVADRAPTLHDMGALGPLHARPAPERWNDVAPRGARWGPRADLPA